MDLRMEWRAIYFFSLYLYCLDRYWPTIASVYRSRKFLIDDLLPALRGFVTRPTVA